MWGIYKQILSVQSFLAGEVTNFATGAPFGLIDVFSFVSGSKYFLRDPLKRQIKYSFVLDPPGLCPRPVAQTCFLNLKIPLIIDQQDMELRWVSALTEGSNRFGRN